MRMRQLGKGHSIAFWASFEADLRIRATCNLSSYDAVSNENIVQFICENSRKFEAENVVHWATAAHNYTQKLAAHKVNDDSVLDCAIMRLYEKCVDNEFVTLNEMYGDKEEALLTDIAKSKFAALNSQYEDNQKIQHFIKTIDDGVAKKLQTHAADVRRFVHSLDEEQEKELEQETEQERQIERPPKLNAATPHFDPDLISLILSGTHFDELYKKRTLISFGTSLMNTKLFEDYKMDASNWAGHLFVTKDFTRVLAAENAQACDQYLRPSWWIARINIKSNILVLLSSYECNCLLPTFRKTVHSTLYMFQPTVSKLHSDLINDNGLPLNGNKIISEISVNDSAQLKMFSGSMYLKNEDEQNAYCNFLGLIPRPRNEQQNVAFESGLIKPNGFVPIENRHHLLAIRECVDQCKFKKNPVDLAIKLIEAHHLFIRKESHASSILERGKKLDILQQ